MLESQQSADPAAGALLFSCNGRETKMFPQPCHDVGVARRAMPDTSAAKNPATGELGPVGGKNFIHAHTASLAFSGRRRTNTQCP